MPYQNMETRQYFPEDCSNVDMDLSSRSRLSLYHSSPISNFAPDGSSPDGFQLSRRNSLMPSLASTTDDGFSVQVPDFSSPVTPPQSSVNHWVQSSFMDAQEYLTADFRHSHTLLAEDRLNAVNEFAQNTASYWVSNCSETPNNSFGELNTLGIAYSRTLTPNIFEDVQHHEIAATPNITVWYSPGGLPAPQTIAPKAILQSILPSSPAFKEEPLTPVREFGNTDAGFHSSPLSITSPTRVILSEPHAVDLTGRLQSEALMQQRFNHARQSQQQPRYRPYVRKTLLSSSSKPRSAISRSGLNCDAIVPQNLYACGFAGCHRRFKRQEHRKRHEKTVQHDSAVQHTKTVRVTDGEERETFICWVEGCRRSFSRSDNLKWHKLKTHGRVSGAQRNRYVATLDRNSQFFDYDWEGRLTKDGYPVRDGVSTISCEVKDCTALFHTGAALDQHMLKHDDKHENSKSCTIKCEKQLDGVDQ